MTNVQTRGIRNNNPLNIRVGNKWKHEKPSTDETQFEVFEEMKWGVRAGFMVLFRYITFYKCNTLRKIISRWAPPSENHTDSYLWAVGSKTYIEYDDKIDYKDKSKMCSIVYWMVYVENGVNIDIRTIEEGYDLAFADYKP